MSSTPANDDELVERMLREHATITVVGASAAQQKAAGYVPRHMQRHGWRIVPVNPRGGSILGEPAFVSLAAAPSPVGLVDVFRPGPECAAIVRDAIAVGADAIWLQLGIVSSEARRLADEAGVAYVEDRCMLVEQRRLGLRAGG